MPNDFSRLERIQDLIQIELAKIIQQEIRDPRLAMVTITEVVVSKDLRHAKIYVTVYPDEKTEISLQVLNRASGYMRSLLAKKITCKNLPSLRFIYDDTTIKANQIDRLIDQVVTNKSLEDDNSDSQVD